MSDVTISYKGVDIATMDASDTKTLLTQGKYCEGNISVAYVKPSGGGSVAQKDVNFYDYDGSIVVSYSAEDFANLTVMPNNPVHTGLTPQGWNWTLADAKTYVAAYGKLDVGQMYVTDDGKTHIYIRLEQGRLAPYFGLAVNGTATIDWGDGSEDSTVTGSSTSTVINTQHIYSTPGDYVITVSVNGNAALLGTSNGSQILWKNSQSNGSRCYQNSIQRVELGAGISIDDYAFGYCYSLTSITLPSNVTSIGDYVFYNCYSLTSITLPSSVTSIGNDAFEYCSSLTSITLPSSVTSISDYVFYNCYSLTSITLPSSVTSIGNDAFEHCYSLTSITLPSNVTSISKKAFEHCYSLTSITLPSSVTSIGKNAFYNCCSLTSITLPSNLTSISDYVFYNCYSLTSITLPSSVTSISDYAFRYCYSLTSITLPSSVTSIGNYAFYGCVGLGEIHFKPSTPPTVSASNAFTNIPTDCIIYVPTGKLTTYTSASNYPSSSTYTYREE